MRIDPDKVNPTPAKRRGVFKIVTTESGGLCECPKCNTMFIAKRPEIDDIVAKLRHITHTTNMTGA